MLIDIEKNTKITFKKLEMSNFIRDHIIEIEFQSKEDEDITLQMMGEFEYPDDELRD